MKFLYFNVLCCILFLNIFRANAQGLDNASHASNNVNGTYSSRLLNSTYAGFCYRVRRASDNAEAWIDFDAATQSITPNSNAIIILPGSSNFVPGTVMSFSRFYTGTSCYVTAWFDQSGNGYDAVQTTASAQPRIVNSGTIEALQYSSSDFTHPKTATLPVANSNATLHSKKNSGR